MTTYWQIEYDNEGIAWLHANAADAAVNILSEAAVSELDHHLDALSASPPKGLIILSDKDKGFIAGADVKRFENLRDKKVARKLIENAHTAINKLAQLDCPTVALIHGHCLGGGLELALACDYLLVCDAPSTQLGLPEVKLGIHPGFGGTVRLIRRIGALAALPFMLIGKTVSARSAVRIGIADERVAERHLRHAAKRYINNHPAVKRPARWNLLFKLAFIRRLVGAQMKKRTRLKVSPQHYPAPFAMIDLWIKHGGNERNMLHAEIESVAELITTNTAQNLVRLFLLRDRLKQFGKQADKFTPKHIHIVGGGIMGGDIAACCALNGLRVTLQDTRPEALAAATQRAHKLFKRKLKAPLLIRNAMDLFIPDEHGAGIPHADVIIEAIIEDLQAKQDLFKNIESRARPDCLLATNTSSLPLEDIGEVLHQPERLVGLHFFNPVAVMPLVEIVHSTATTQANIDNASAFALQLGKLPLPVKSSPGFLVNRILMPYLLEAITMLGEGIPATIIDDAALDFGMPIGPIQLADQVGLDICQSVAQILGEHLGLSMPDSLRDAVTAGHLGKKSGQGFYRYVNDKPVRVAAASHYKKPTDITDRLMCSLFNEAVNCLRDEIVSDADLLDAGVVFGTGFAPHLGGPMHYIASRGSDTMLSTLHHLEERHGARFHTDDTWSKWVVNI